MEIMPSQHEPPTDRDRPKRGGAIIGVVLFVVVMIVIMVYTQFIRRMGG
ncbi:MAG: hypothetical protein WCI05_14645 [Myxococcales bacterium]|jgi:hypothetical protein